MVSTAMDNREMRRRSFEKEPFLADELPQVRRRRNTSSTLVVALWLLGHIVVFSVFSIVLVSHINTALHNAGLSVGGNDTVKVPTHFGGLPVLHDHSKGPYVTCESTGSPNAARETGCQFDLFVNGWVPSPCFDLEKHAYFVQQHDYYFWVDKAGQQRVPKEKLLEGNLEWPELFVSFEEHFEHCRYLLNATKRYANNPNLGVLDVHMDEEHMNHCIDFLKESRDPHTVESGVIAYFGYRKCFLPRWDKA